MDYFNGGDRTAERQPGFGKRSAAALVMVLLAASGCDSPRRSEGPTGVAALRQAVVQHDIVTTQALLKQGVDPNARTDQGDTAPKSALTAVTGTTRDPVFSSKTWDASDPKLAVMRTVMAVIRRSSRQPFDGTGKLEVMLSKTGESLERGMSFVSSLKLVEPSGDEGELVLSRWETELVGIDWDGWSVTLKPGGTYRVWGAKQDGKIEVERIQMTAPPAAGDSFTLPVVNYLPSTFERMQALTWLGEKKNERP